jgi:hypothetical protein
VLHESADGGQAAIACARRIASSRFEIVEEGEDPVDGDVIEAKVRDRATSVCGEERKKRRRACPYARTVCALAPRTRRRWSSI